MEKYKENDFRSLSQYISRLDIIFVQYKNIEISTNYVFPSGNIFPDQKTKNTRLSMSRNCDTHKPPTDIIPLLPLGNPDLKASWYV